MTSFIMSFIPLKQQPYWYLCILMKVTDFCILLCTLLIYWFTVLFVFQLFSLSFLWIQSYHLQIGIALPPPFSFTADLFYLSIVLVSISKITLNNNSNSRYLYLVPYFSGNSSSISPLNMMLPFGVRLYILCYIMLKA